MWKKYLKFILLGVVLIVLGVVLFIRFYIFKEAATSVASKKADIILEAGDLVNSFETDEKTANTNYLNKIVEVKGVVDNVADSKSDISVYLKQKGKTSGVMCSFDKAEYQKNPVKPGDHVSIKGICSGYLMDVVLNKCAVKK
jgi:hypothetical protein